MASSTWWLAPDVMAAQREWLGEEPYRPFGGRRRSDKDREDDGDRRERDRPDPRDPGSKPAPDWIGGPGQADPRYYDPRYDPRVPPQLQRSLAEALPPQPQRAALADDIPARASAAPRGLMDMILGSLGNPGAGAADARSSGYGPIPGGGALGGATSGPNLKARLAMAQMGLGMVSPQQQQQHQQLVAAPWGYGGRY